MSLDCRVATKDIRLNELALDKIITFKRKRMKEKVDQIYLIQINDNKYFY